MAKLKNRNEEDVILIKKIRKNNCNSSYNSLQEKHSNLYYSICNKFGNQLNLDEIYKDKDFVMYKAIMSYKEDMGAKFSTWLGNYSRYHCLNYIKNNHKYINSEEDKIVHFFNKKSLVEYDSNKDFQNEIDHAFAILEKLSDKRIFKIFKLRYMHEGPRLTWKEIAAEFDLTPQTIINLHSKGRRILVKKMKNQKNP